MPILESLLISLHSCGLALSSHCDCVALVSRKVNTCFSSSTLGGAHALYCSWGCISPAFSNIRLLHIAELFGVFSTPKPPETKYRGVNSTLPDFVLKLHIQSRAFSGCQVFVRLWFCSGLGVLAALLLMIEKHQVPPALRHLLRHLRDDPDPLVLTSLI